MPGASRTIVINAPIEKVFDVITQYERYPEFLSEVKETRTANRKDNTVDVHYKVDVMKTVRYSIRVVEERPRRMSWTFIEGEVMKDNKGSWVLEPEGEGKTRATYNVEMALGLLVPKAVVNALVDTSLPKMLEAFKRRAEAP
ncbi:MULTISPECIES: type II toxin-antitoxin system RatA family toxin [Myxococcus]|uniref:SRPBCC family protein n=1 Tax=Myxococcus llanfairpwllgwyngyllgogerychwyrndrobwllllantysiliogogogochensis TaxID=2590453 RepID=A0A540WU31_9BACT|nr:MULTISPECIES: SRPBCC family protein [Myxococcus]NTX01900.1 SRPBCC family protein [Myxococcus sp. CA040A]NTX14612.1 SRPBCC family protein [Myxococcus sp. CA056]NTX38728.1 SRPBCC family protein [Myxococcus sp. CA033]TQF12518.1 SRPBCC family protein [Myxococcus llanfairpwllgwyngyllgogerychwyrndrobwllllantysiliogogogochensis]